MNKKIKLFIMAVLCAVQLPAFGHPPAAIDTIRPLQIGDTVPDALWHLPMAVVNHPDGRDTITLAAYRGKLIILDFWNTSCIPCIKAFPKLRELQSTFEGSIQFLLSNRQPEVRIREFTTRHPLPEGLPTLVDQQTLYAYFPYRVVPHYVWIGPDGRVAAITNGAELTAHRVHELLEGKTTLTMKHDILTDPPYFLRPVVDPNQVYHYTIFYSGYYTGLPSKVIYHETEGRWSGISVSNYRLSDLYKLAAMSSFSRLGASLTTNRCLIEVSDTTALRQFYTYERITPLLGKISLDSLMLQDLNDISDYNGRIEARQVSCYVIHADKAAVGFTSTLTNAQQRKLLSLINLWNAAMGRLGEDALLIDESGYTGTIDASITRIRDIPALQHALRPYGLQVIHATRTLPMLVISENLKNQNL